MLAAGVGPRARWLSAARTSSLRPFAVAAAVARRVFQRPLSAPAPARAGARCPQATARRCAEPAWHRRQRRQRGSARVLLRLAAATNLLQGHHSAQRGPLGASTMPNGRAGSSPTPGASAAAPAAARWDCRVCGIEANYATRARCRLCGGYRPSGVGGSAQSANGGGGGGGGGGSAGGGGANGRWRNGGSGGGGGGGRPGAGSTTTNGPTVTLAHRQLQSQHDHMQRQLAEARKREENLRAENRRLQRDTAPPAQRDKTGGGDDEEMDGDDADDANEASESDRRKRIDETKNGIPYLVTRYGEGSAEVAQARSELAALEKAAREAKPYRTHRARLERRKGRLEKQQERGRQEADDLLAQVEALQARLNAVNKANDERELAIQAVDGELRELLKRAIADGDSDGSAPTAATHVDPGAAWNTVTTTLEAMSSMPGVPREWAAQLGGLVEQLRTATIAIQARANYTAAAAAASSTSAVLRPVDAAPPSQPAAATAAAPQLGGPVQLQETPRPAQQQHSDGAQQEWEQRALELAFADGAAGPIANGDSTPGQAAANATAEAAVTATPPRAEGKQPAPKSGQDAENESGSDDDDDDDMASICEDEFRLREGETEQQRKRRVAVYLRSRDKARRERKHRERDRESRAEWSKKEAGNCGSSNRVKTDAFKKK